MSEKETTKVRLKVPPQVARIVGSGAPRDLQLSAARGALSLSEKDLLTSLFFLCNSKDAEIRKAAIRSLKELPESILSSAIEDTELHPNLLDLVARANLAKPELICRLIVHPAVLDSTLIYLAQRGDQGLLERLAGHQQRLSQTPALVEAIIANPGAERALKLKLGWQDPEAKPSEADPSSEKVEDPDDVDVEATMEEAEEEGLSKYQIAMELRVSEKIKMGLTGDKEWRSILMKDSNKLVQGAVIKNPRISDGEVLMIAKTKTSSDDLIRQILLNKDWMKLYEMKKALAVHPKTPVPKAIRLISFLTTKDVKDLMKSKGVSTVIVTTARKEFENRQKRGGG